MGGTSDHFDGNCDGQNGLHTHFARQRSVWRDGVAWCEQGFKLTSKLVLEDTSLVPLGLIEMCDVDLVGMDLVS